MFGLEKLFSGKGVAGLDIGSSSLKLAEISDTPEGYELKTLAGIYLPRNVIAGGVILDRETLTGKIRELFKNSGCKARNIVTSLSGHNVIIKRTGFSSMDEEEFRLLLNDEADKYLPFEDIREVNFDFQILGESDTTPGQMDVVLAAARKEIINTFMEAVNKAGLKVVIMDVDPFALETMYEANYDFEEQDVVVLVNIGASITNINVIKKGGSIFTRDFSIGGDAITEIIQKKLGIEFDEAEAVKTAVSGGREDRGVTASDLVEIADPILSEIERSVDYFRSTYGSEFIRRVIAGGGSAVIPGILPALTQRLNIETELVNPLQNIRIDRKKFDQHNLEEIGSRTAIAVGLALRRLNDR
ncbi:MAG: type IV pilus assembly protein PilM [Syntrophales bacterium]|nr:type IV pilus assembly protein PilM [Syntrophales bacterium]